jgi:hypothetical protein
MELTDKVYLDNLCDWPLYFRRLNGIGDIAIPAKAKNFTGVDVAEAQMQIQSGNHMFIGTDGMGGHARIRIVDDEQRKALLGYDDGGDAIALTADSLRELFAVKRKDAFQQQLEALVTTNAEKRMVQRLAKEAGGDDAASWKMDAINALAETAEL